MSAASGRQRPLGSGFTAASTAEEVLAGADLAGVNVIVTGGGSGIGLAAVRALARAGAAVTVATRDPGRAADHVDGTAGVQVHRLDLLDPDGIEAFAGAWAAGGRALHVLVNGAAVPTPGSAVRDHRGYEVQFATSHLGHFQLTLALRGALRAARGARVVNVSSGAHRLGGIQWDDPHSTRSYDPGLAYAQAKTAGVLHAVALDRRWAAEGVRGYAVHPGVVLGTGLTSGGDPATYRAMGLLDRDGHPVIDPAAGTKTAEQAAATLVFAATSPQLRGIGGVYLKDSDIAPVDDRRLQPAAGVIPADAASHALDPGAADRLWELSLRLLAVPGQPSGR